MLITAEPLAFDTGALVAGLEEPTLASFESTSEAVSGLILALTVLRAKGLHLPARRSWQLKGLITRDVELVALPTADSGRNLLETFDFALLLRSLGSGGACLCY